MKIVFLLVLSGCFLLTACDSSRMTTVINGNGSCERIFSSPVSDDFIKGDTSGHPFPVNLTGWAISWELKDEGLNMDWPARNWQRKGNDSIPVATAYASKHFKSVQELSDSFRFKPNHPWANIRVKPRLEKTFRWFYSYYNYQEVFSGVPAKPLISLDRYLTRAESGYWLTGRPDITKGMNGQETKDLLDEIETKAKKWFVHNLFEFQYAVLLDNLLLFPGCPDKELMLEKKDSVFAWSYDNNVYEMDVTVNLGVILNKYFKTKAFDPLVNAEDDEKFQKILNPEHIEEISHYFDASVEYRLKMPGDVLQSNGVLSGDTLSWKVDALRLLNGDYLIEATSKKINTWAWVVSIFIIIVAIVSCLFVRRSSVFH